MLLGSAVPGSSLVSFYFRWAILCPQAVQSCVKEFLISSENIPLLTPRLQYVAHYFSQPFPKPGRKVITQLCILPTHFWNKINSEQLYLIRHFHNKVPNPVLNESNCHPNKENKERTGPRTNTHGIPKWSATISLDIGWPYSFWDAPAD